MKKSRMKLSQLNYVKFAHLTQHWKLSLLPIDTRKVRMVFKYLRVISCSFKLLLFFLLMSQYFCHLSLSPKKNLANTHFATFSLRGTISYIFSCPPWLWLWRCLFLFYLVFECKLTYFVFNCLIFTSNRILFKSHLCLISLLFQEVWIFRFILIFLLQNSHMPKISTNIGSEGFCFLVIGAIDELFGLMAWE